MCEVRLSSGINLWRNRWNYTCFRASLFSFSCAQNLTSLILFTQMLSSLAHMHEKEAWKTIKVLFCKRSIVWKANRRPSKTYRCHRREKPTSVDYNTASSAQRKIIIATNAQSFTINYPKAMKMSWAFNVMKVFIYNWVEDLSTVLLNLLSTDRLTSMWRQQQKT